MSVRPASPPPPTPSSSSTQRPSSSSRPRPPRATSFCSPLPSVGLSSTTVRSSSTTRPPSWLPSVPAAPRASTEERRTPSYRAEDELAAARAGGGRTALDAGGGKENVSQRGQGRERRPPGRGSDDGKGKAAKAVASVVGLPSSGDEGDVEGDEGDSGGEEDEDGLGAASFEEEVPKGGRESIAERIIRLQIPQPIQTVDSLDLDSLLSGGIADYTFVAPPAASAPSSSSSASTSSEVSARTVLGKGKFSEVFLVRKGGTEYAIKHTPLHPHHPLIAARLLREPTILSKLPAHRNLVKVFETIRTPGSFYLIQESLQTSVTLEALVSSSPGGVLPTAQAWSVLEQLASVVRSLHEPLRVCHRDIKPENVLVRLLPAVPSSTSPPPLHLKLLDFGLATHFSSTEPKLTTCCGSPAYHSPELWRSLREAAGEVRYWGPEIDVWCTGLTVLRCLRPDKYPLGASHASLRALSDKVVDALLGVRDSALRQVLAGFLNLDGGKRMRAFERFCRGMEQRERDRRADSSGPATESQAPKPRSFKSTSFLPSPVEHRLPLYLDDTRSALSPGPKLEAEVVTPDNDDGWQRPPRAPSTSRTPTALSPTVSPTTVIATGLPLALDDSPEVLQAEAGSSSASTSSATLPSRSPTPDLSPYPPATVGLYPSSSDSLASTTYSPFSPSTESLPFRQPSLPPPIELALLNPTEQPAVRAASYIKYALRCSGILYHVQDDSASSSRRSSLAGTESAPPSLPPTPYIQSFAPLPPLSSSSTTGFPFPSSPRLGEPDDSCISYLHCVLALPPASDPSASPTTASHALRAALSGSADQPDPLSSRRPLLPPRARSLATLGGAQRSASTPPGTASVSDQGARSKNQEKKELVQALSFFLSIRRTTSPAPSSPHPPAPPAWRSGSITPLASRLPPSSSSSSRRPSAQRRTSSACPDTRATASSRIVVALSDSRALPFVRAALDLPHLPAAESASPTAVLPTAQAETRGRSRFNGGALSPRRGNDNSGSRDARARRVQRLQAGSEFGGEGRTGGYGRSQSVDVRRKGLGLGMEMGPPSPSLAGDAAGQAHRRRTSSLWDFDLAGLVSRFVGGTKEGSASASTSLDRGGEGGTSEEQRGRVKASVEAAAGLL